MSRLNPKSVRAKIGKGLNCRGAKGFRDPKGLWGPKKCLGARKRAQVLKGSRPQKGFRDPKRIHGPKKESGAWKRAKVPKKGSGSQKGFRA